MWALLLALAAAGAASDCPRHCECKWRSGKESALCTRAGFTSVPPLLATTTQLLDLTENRLNQLRDETFYAAGLIHLQRLYLTSCTVKNIRPRAFHGLVNLVELDLCQNRLDTIPSHTFAEIHELRELRLDGNPIASIKDEAFVLLPNLVRLSLKACRITDIEPRSFVGLEGSLEYLMLEKNRLQVLHAAVLAPLRTLKGLELANNPWECSCALRPMREWMLRRNVPATVVPECALPPRLAQHTWDKLDLEDFACLPEVEVDTKKTVGTEGEKVTLVCKVSGIPAPRVRWYRGGRLVANSSSYNPNSERLILLYSEGKTINLTIKSADMQDAGLYSCSAENRAGKAEGSQSLTMQRRPPDKGLSVSALLAGMAVSLVIVLIVCAIVLCLYETRKKRQIDRWNEQIVNTNHRAETNYEKIEMNLIKSTADDSGIAMECESSRRRGDYRNLPCHDPEEGEGYAVRGGREVTWRTAERSPPAVQSWSMRMPEDDHQQSRLPDYKRAVATPESVPSSASSMTAHLKSKVYHGLNNNRQYPRERVDNDLSGSDSEKNYPDIIEMSSIGSMSYMQNTKKHDPYFYTVPRRKDTDSRSPLLGSRRNSSGGDSTSSFGYEPRPKPARRRSNSFLDLAMANSRLRHNPSLPASPIKDRPAVPSATPLLDLSGLRNYSQRNQPEDNDFRASQLERFLEEYVILREHLTRMKETRESLQRNRAADNEELRSMLKSRTSVAVTETSQATLADAASPLTLSTDQHAGSNWITPSLYRN